MSSVGACRGGEQRQHMSLLELKRKRFKCYFANPMKIKDQERMFISLLVYAAKALLRTAH
jgi:hypothetical protein